MADELNVLRRLTHAASGVQLDARQSALVLPGVVASAPAMRDPLPMSESDLTAVAPIVGTARIVSATGNIVRSLGLAIELAEVEEQARA
jgi:hypothetical protein